MNRMNRDKVTDGIRSANCVAAIGAVLVIAMLAYLVLFGTGCINVTHTRYANNNVENMQPDSRGVASQGNAAANAGTFSDTAAVTAPAPADGQGGQGDGDRAIAFFSNTHSDRASDVDTAAALQAMRDTENSTGSQTSPQAIDTSTAQGESTASPTITETDTVTPTTLSGNAVQVPNNGSSTGAQTQGEGVSGDNASSQGGAIDCATCGKTGVTPTGNEAGDTWTCARCGTVVPWETADCPKDGCDGCRDCQPNP